MRSTITIHLDRFELISLLPPEEYKEVMAALVRFQKTGEPAVFGSVAAQIGFNALLQSVEHNNAQYDEAVRKRSEAGKKSAEIRQRQAKNHSPEHPSTPFNTAQQHSADGGNVNHTDSDPDPDPVADAIDLYTRNPELRESLRQWAEDRKAKKKPLTLNAAKLAFKVLDSAANDTDRVKIVRKSVLGGYQGLFPIRDNQTRVPKPLPADTGAGQAGEIARVLANGGFDHD